MELARIEHLKQVLLSVLKMLLLNLDAGTAVFSVVFSLVGAVSAVAAGVALRVITRSGDHHLMGGGHRQGTIVG